MSVLEFAAALDGARTLAFVDEIARDLWQAYGAGKIGESDAEGIAARIEEARQKFRPRDRVEAQATVAPLATASMFPPRKRRCVSPDRAKSRERRRRLAYSGPLPPALAAGFTTGQLATLRIVADEVRAHGCCTLSLAEISARAGVCVTLARNAIRLAANDGLAVIVERRRHGRPSLTNVIRIISQQWIQWIRRGAQGGSKKANPKDTKNLDMLDVSLKGEKEGPKGTAADCKATSPVRSRSIDRAEVHKLALKPLARVSTARERSANGLTYG
uniref:hypothetical protein n=1 Tax=uncultured Rhizobium sp. TaxID=155567 RepID=UPI002627E1E6|nr:hypothetical protein [uncultured Rhizobium sp.]